MTPTDPPLFRESHVPRLSTLQMREGHDNRFRTHLLSTILDDPLHVQIETLDPCLTKVLIETGNRKIVLSLQVREATQDQKFTHRLSMLNHRGHD
jgi:hypothetical protein